MHFEVGTEQEGALIQDLFAEISHWCMQTTLIGIDCLGHEIRIIIYCFGLRLATHQQLSTLLWETFGCTTLCQARFHCLSHRPKRTSLITLIKYTGDVVPGLIQPWWQQRGSRKGFVQQQSILIVTKHGHYKFNTGMQ